jgi:hypothetical protein
MEKFISKDSGVLHNHLGIGSKAHGWGYLEPVPNQLLVGGKGKTIQGKELYLRIKDGFIRVVKVGGAYLLWDKTIEKKVGATDAHNSLPTFLAFKATKEEEELLANAVKTEEKASSASGDHYEFSETANMPEEFSNGIGNWVKGVFTKKETIKTEYTPEELAEKHKKSGSKVSFGDWLKTDNGKSIVSTLSGISSSILNKNGGTGNKGTGDDEKKSADIFGMKPLTFALVSIAVIGASIGAFIYFSNKSTPLKK